VRFKTAIILSLFIMRTSTGDMKVSMHNLTEKKNESKSVDFWILPRFRKGEAIA